MTTVVVVVAVVVNRTMIVSMATEVCEKMMKKKKRRRGKRNGISLGNKKTETITSSSTTPSCRNLITKQHLQHLLQVPSCSSNIYLYFQFVNLKFVSFFFLLSLFLTSFFYFDKK